MALTRFREEKVHRDAGKFASAPGRGAAPTASPAGRAPQAPLPSSSARLLRVSDADRTWRRVITQPIAQKEGKPGGAAGAQLPTPILERLKQLGVSKLPAAHITEVHVSPRVEDNQAAHRGALLIWKDDKGREQRAYSAEFDRRNAEKKWARVLKGRPAVEAATGGWRTRAEASPAHAVVLLMATTGLRPGSEESVRLEQHYGATTLEARHITFSGGAAQIEFVGKSGKTNRATVEDPALAAALRKFIDGPPPKEPTDRVFDVDLEAIRATTPPGVKLKDLRTIVAATTAEDGLKGVTVELTGDDSKDAKRVLAILKSISNQVAAKLNNTAAVARKSYIPPQVIREWGERNGLPAEWLK